MNALWDQLVDDSKYLLTVDQGEVSVEAIIAETNMKRPFWTTHFPRQLNLLWWHDVLRVAVQDGYVHIENVYPKNLLPTQIYMNELLEWALVKMKVDKNTVRGVMFYSVSEETANSHAKEAMESKTPIRLNMVDSVFARKKFPLIRGALRSFPWLTRAVIFGGEYKPGDQGPAITILQYER